MKNSDPLAHNVRIVDANGFPTDEFMIKWARQHSVNSDIPDLSTQSLVSAVLDKITAAVGSLLVRGASLWGGLASPSDATKFLNGAATPAFAQVKDSDLSTSDITTNDVSTTKHGFVPKAPNDVTKFLDGTGAFSTPASSGDISPFSDGGITKPAAADFTIADDTTSGHGTGSKANLAHRGVELTFTAGTAGTSQSLFYQSAVSNTLGTMVAYIAPNFGGQNGSNQYFYGLAVRDNAGKIDAFGLCFDAGVGNTVWKHATFTNISTAPTISAFNGGHMACGRPMWLKLAKVSTNFVFSVSSNGETYDTIATVSATGFVGATLNDVGIVLYDGMNNGSKIINLDCFSFTKS